jgi:DNA-binding NarL/FixJ family response regulator
MRILLRSYLTHHGMEISFEAENGRQLLNYLQQTSRLPDVCILDANMPVLSGYATAKQIISRFSGVGIIALSFFDATREARMLGNGADICVDKGSRPEEIISAVKEIAERQKSFGHQFV